MNKQQKAIYQYLLHNGEATIVQLRENLYIAKPCMRIAEMNRAHREKHGTDLIVTSWKKKNGEHVKRLASRLQKKEQRVEIIDGVAHVTYVTVPV